MSTPKTLKAEFSDKRSVTMPVGVVMRCSPGVTRWQKKVWRAIAVLPGAGPADYKEMRRDGDVVEYHAATETLELHRKETEGYLVSMAMAAPTIFVVLRRDDDPESDYEYQVHCVTVSAYEAQDYMDSGEEIVEPVPMPEGLVAWVREFTDAHHREEKFIKRKRDRKRVDLVQDGIGDARIRQEADVFRAPRSQRKPGGPDGGSVH